MPVPAAESTLDALREGDEAAFTALVRAHHAELVRFATLRTRDRATAEESVQETWVVFLERLEEFEGRSSIRTFLFGILINRLRARLRSDARTVPFSSIAEDAPSIEPERFAPIGTPWAGHWMNNPAPWPSGEDAVSRRELREAIFSAIDLLPDREREVITLRDGLGWESVEICALLEINDGHLRVVLHRARMRVRAALEKHFASG